MTDNALAYRRSQAWRHALADIGAQARFTRRYRPRPTAKPNASTAPSPTNGPTNAPTPATRTAPTPYQHGYTYNYHRSHTATGGKPPISRVSNGAGYYA